MSKVTESQFAMWRTLFAVAHVDNVITGEELRFMAEIMEDVPFTEEQRAVLNTDIKIAQDIEEMFKGVTDIKDQAAFFKYAKDLVHIDGDYGADEQRILLKLKETHIKVANLDDLIGTVRMELEEEKRVEPPVDDDPKRTWREVLSSFRNRFIRDKDLY